MARRLYYVGSADDVARLQERHRLVPDGEYVFGRYSEATDEAGLLWADLNRCYRLAGLTAKQRMVHRLAIQLKSLREIADQFGVHHSTIEAHLKVAEAKLERVRGDIGVWTNLVEDCGGWAAVRLYLDELD